MRKTVCIALVLGMLLSLTAALGISVSADNVNVALGCPYTGSAPYTTDADQYGKTNYRYKTGTELTDGQKGKSTGNEEWYALYGAATYHIDIDLGSKKDSLAEFSAQFEEKTDWGIVLPRAVTYYASNDGDTYSKLGEAEKTPTENTQYFEYLLRLGTPVSARYIRMEATSGGTFAFVSEIEVWQGVARYEDTFRLADRAYAKLSADTLRIPPETSVASFPSFINSMDGVTLKGADGNPKTEGILSTGDTLTKYHESGDDLYYIVVDGDIDGNALINSKDYLLVKRHALRTHTLEGGALRAGDLDGDGSIKASEYAKIKRHVLGTFDLYEEYGPTDGRGDVTEKFKSKVKVPEISTPETWDMTVKRTTNVQYQMTCQTDDGKITMSLHQTPWGTWNLGIWTLTDSKGTHAFSSESTDWEYVYRARKSKSVSEVFSGGNHANEKLRSIKLFDGITGNEINLSVGQSTEVRQLRITEETKLYYDPAGDDGKYNYSEDDMYCLAVRNYTIVGPQIRLEVDYDYQKDVYYGLSYTCMMPIAKTLGLYCAYVNPDGKIDKIYETLKVGDPSYNGAFYYSQSANRAILFGYGDEAKYRIDVQVDTGTDTINAEGKERSRFWDMNQNTNKLYFCNYGSSNLVSAGAKRHTSVQWTMFVEK